MHMTHLWEITCLQLGSVLKKISFKLLIVKTFMNNSITPTKFSTLAKCISYPLFRHGHIHISMRTNGFLTGQYSMKDDVEGFAEMPKLCTDIYNEFISTDIPLLQYP